MFLIESIDNQILSDANTSDYDKILSHFAMNCTIDDDETFVSKFMSMDRDVILGEDSIDMAEKDFEKAKKIKIKERGSAFVKLMKKAVSLKSDDIEKTQSFRFKVLRAAIVVLPVIGVASIPIGLFASLLATMSAASLSARYTFTRREKEISVFEAHIEYLEDKIDQADNPEKVKELRIVQSDMRKQVAKLKKKTKSLSKSKDNDDDWD